MPYPTELICKYLSLARVSAAREGEWKVYPLLQRYDSVQEIITANHSVVMAAGGRRKARTAA